MSNLTSLDWWVGLYFVSSGVAVAFTIGQSLVKLLLLRFASRSVSMTRFGALVLYLNSVTAS